LSTQDLQSEQAHVGTSIRAVLDRFAGRPLDPSLVADLAEALNQELVSALAGRRIVLTLGSSSIEVDLTPVERSVDVIPDARPAASAGYDAVLAALAA